MNHRRRRRLGQHFLRDHAVIRAIVAAIAPAPTDNIVEIGPGDGALTDALISAGARVLAVEIDGELAAALQARHGGDLLRVARADVLDCDWGELLGDGGDARVVGNLPYSASAPILLRLAETAGQWRDAHVMTQQEMAARLLAAPGDGEYGRLSACARLAYAAEELFTVPPAAFAPPPKVVSAVLRLAPLPAPGRFSPTAESLLRDAFSHRRKTIKNALAEWEIDWDAAPIDSRRRPQTLAPAEFAALAAHVDGRGGGAGGGEVVESPP